MNLICCSVLEKTNQLPSNCFVCIDLLGECLLICFIFLLRQKSNCLKNCTCFPCPSSTSQSILSTLSATVITTLSTFSLSSSSSSSSSSAMQPTNLVKTAVSLSSLSSSSSSSSSLLSKKKRQQQQQRHLLCQVQ